MTPLLVLTTVGADYDAVPLARDLVAAHLAACVNVLPGVESIYWWEKQVVQEGEKVLLIKTTDERLHELQTALLARHPYDVPEFVVIRPEQVEARYAAWIGDAVSS